MVVCATLNKQVYIGVHDVVPVGSVTIYYAVAEF